MSFPENFVWGAATASYQIEGAATADGKGRSVWDMMCETPGAIWRGQNGSVACDHYHLVEPDIELMGKLGIKAYRFSISWPRVLPDGIGAVNQAGLDFYSRLVDLLLAQGIEPYITLFHWDYPYELFLKGGWLNRESVDWFAEYTQVVVDCLKDRVSHWITLNEPQCFIGLGHYDGIHAPGLKLNLSEVLTAGHHSLLAHGKSVQVIRSLTSDAQVGYAPVGLTKIPATDSPSDIEAARQATFTCTEPGYWDNAWWMDPVYLGTYPEQGMKVMEPYLPRIESGDMDTISQPLDFFGFNNYHSEVMTTDAAGQPVAALREDGFAMQAMDTGWPVTPEGLYWGPKFFYERYQKPIIITENGMTHADWVGLDGKVHDEQRIDFLRRYLSQFGRAHDDSVDIRGYFVWTFMDNFEWAFGYSKRFGLVHIDFETQKRTPKESAYWYAKTIAENGANLA